MLLGLSRWRALLGGSRGMGCDMGQEPSYTVPLLSASLENPVVCIHMMYVVPDNFDGGLRPAGSPDQ